jgi:hypothetical protein
MLPTQDQISHDLASRRHHSTLSQSSSFQNAWNELNASLAPRPVLMHSNSGGTASPNSAATGDLDTAYGSNRLATSFNAQPPHPLQTSYASSSSLTQDAAVMEQFQRMTVSPDYKGYVR